MHIKKAEKSFKNNRERQVYSTQFPSDFKSACLYKYNDDKFGRVYILPDHGEEFTE